MTFRKSFFGWLNSCNMQMRLNVSLLRLWRCYVMEESLAVHFILIQPNCTWVGVKGIDWLVGVSKGKVRTIVTSCLNKPWVVSIHRIKWFFCSLLDCKKQNVFQYNSGLKYGRALSHCRYQEMNLTVRLIDQWSTRDQLMHLKKMTFRKFCLGHYRAAICKRDWQCPFWVFYTVLAA